MNQKNYLAEKLKELRLSHNLLQKQVAEYLKIVKSTYSQYETGKSRPDYETLKKIARLYNVSLDELLNHEIIISEDIQTFDFKRINKMVKKDLGDKGVLFYDQDKMTKEELKIIKAIFSAIDDENKRE